MPKVDDQPKLVKKSDLPKPLFPSETPVKSEAVKVEPKKEVQKSVEVKVEEPVKKKEAVVAVELAPVVVAPAVVEEKPTKVVAEEEAKSLDWRGTVEKFELQREASVQG